ncbi:dihydropteroate synthase [Marinicella gelatinilytica]|uniref:dihydropteroate synthase n=1 Tax=Marinicella gelatinilytica TaxID=2996017 RepID=UPI002260C62E|nr:dihydropteroate synthase [Marinicella gelatinilytica]MCX7544356.1 dihydropteroate synthase [Marinicella gelatinilytica]
MGVLNVTPDSFSDGGQFYAPSTAIKHAQKMIADGADIIDIGGESTRPGAAEVSEQAEIERVVPIIEALREQFPKVTLSIDSRKPEVMAAALHAGANFINDINALQSDGAIEVALEYDVPVCLMHMQGTPKTMQDNPQYDNVVQSVLDFFEQRVEACMRAGIDPDRIILDPGIGFGKTVEHNLTLIKNISTLKQMGFPVLLGVSRKSMFKTLLGRAVDERLPGALAVSQFAYFQGTDVFRTHDVAATRDLLTMSQYLIQNEPT